MRLRSINLGFILISQALSAFAGNYESLDKIREVAEQALRASHPLVLAPHTLSVEIKAGNLDQRLLLAACDKPLTPETNPARRSSRLTVKVSCQSNQPWSVYVPVTISAETEVLVANNHLPRGHIITANDLSFEVRRLKSNSRGFMHEPEMAVGKALKRPASIGDTIMRHNLTRPLVIKRGDQVTLEASAGAITVVASGVAMSNGHIGEQIKVKNTSSKRIVNARIVNQGTVRVTL